MNNVTMQGGGVSVKTTQYENFRGVDLTTDPTKVDLSRSPNAPNLTADSGGFPEKRPGWRTLQTVDKPINGLYYTVIGEKAEFIAHGGDKVYRWVEPDINVREHVTQSTDEAINSGHMQVIKGDMGGYSNVTGVRLEVK